MDLGKAIDKVFHGSSLAELWMAESFQKWIGKLFCLTLFCHPKITFMPKPFLRIGKNMGGQK
jgi:hypothetical protein